MILIVADAADAEAAGLAHRWASSHALLMTPGDLSEPGWVVEFPRAGPRFVADGGVRDVHELSGVLVRLPAVTTEHLASFRDADRAYAAAEMTAFLAYWLSALKCPVVNRPSPSSLLGPAWSTDRWRTEAARIGLSLNEPNDSGGAGSAQLRLVTVTGGEAVGGDFAEQTAAIALAAHAGVDFVGVLFGGDGPWVASVTLRPPITADAADRLLTRLGGAP